MSRWKKELRIDRVKCSTWDCGCAGQRPQLSSACLASLGIITMALNWAMLDTDRSPIPLPHEKILRTIESGAEVILTIPNTPPSANASSGGSGGIKKLKEMGRLWLTDQRVR